MTCATTFDLTASFAANPEPIREHYRNTRDPELRGAIAFLMGADR